MEASRARPDGGRCPFCKAGLDDGALKSACAGCGTVHHLTCFATHGGCSTHGCGSARATAEREPSGGRGPPEMFCGACGRGLPLDDLVAFCGGCHRTQHAGCYERIGLCALGGACHGQVELLPQPMAIARRLRRAAMVVLGLGSFIAATMGALALLVGATAVMFIAAGGVAMIVGGLLQLARARTYEALTRPPRPRSLDSKKP